MKCLTDINVKNREKEQPKKNIKEWKSKIRTMRIEPGSGLTNRSIGVVAKRQEVFFHFTETRDKQRGVIDSTPIIFMNRGYYIGFMSQYGNPPNPDRAHWNDQFDKLLSDSKVPRVGSGIHIEVPIIQHHSVSAFQQLTAGCQFESGSQIMTYDALEAMQNRFSLERGTGSFTDEFFSSMGPQMTQILAGIQNNNFMPESGSSSSGLHAIADGSAGAASGINAQSVEQLAIQSCEIPTTPVIKAGEIDPSLYRDAKDQRTRGHQSFPSRQEVEDHWFSFYIVVEIHK